MADRRPSAVAGSETFAKPGWSSRATGRFSAGARPGGGAGGGPVARGRAREDLVEGGDEREKPAAARVARIVAGPGGEVKRAGGGNVSASARAAGAIAGCPSARSEAASTAKIPR